MARRHVERHVKRVKGRQERHRKRVWNTFKKLARHKGCYEAPKGGRLPAGVKLDTLTALNEAFTVDDFSDFVSSIQSRVAELQSARRVSRAKLSATPESVIAAVKSGRISLEELKAQLDAMES